MSGLEGRTQFEPAGLIVHTEVGPLIVCISLSRAPLWPHQSHIDSFQECESNICMKRHSLNVYCMWIWGFLKIEHFFKSKWPYTDTLWDIEDKSQLRQSAFMIPSPPPFYAASVEMWCELMHMRHLWLLACRKTKEKKSTWNCLKLTCVIWKGSSGLLLHQSVNLSGATWQDYQALLSVPGRWRLRKRWLQR